MNDTQKLIEEAKKKIALLKEEIKAKKVILDTLTEELKGLE